MNMQLQQLRSEKRQFPLAMSQLVAEIDYEKLAQEYQFFQIKTTAPFFQQGSQLLDSPLLNQNVMAIQYERGNCINLMMRHCDTNAQQLRQLLHQNQEEDTVTLHISDPKGLKEHQLLQLLFNSLWAMKHEQFRCSNLTGRLYVFHPKWFKHAKDRQAGRIIKQIPTLELQIREHNYLEMNIRTFSNIRYQKLMRFSGKRRFRDLVQYTCTGQNLLQRQVETTATEERFVLRQIGNQRTTIPFLELQNMEQFAQSKLGVVTKVLEQFANQFGECVSLKFQTIPEHTQVRGLKVKPPKAYEMLQGKNRKLPQKLTVIDTIATPESETLCNALIAALNRSGRVKAKTGKRLSKTSYNLKLVHEPEYYETKVQDPYAQKLGYSIQHLTYEAITEEALAAEKLPPLLETILNELYIKEDLQQGKIELYDWEQLRYEQPWTFILPHEVKETATQKAQMQYYEMTIAPDGQFEITKHQADLFQHTLTQQLISICEQEAHGKAPILGLVRNHQGEINLIRETNLYPVPEIAAIQHELQNGNTHLRNEAQRNNLLNAMLEITWFQQQGNYYYFVGSIGSGVKPSFKDANRIRQIESYQHDPIFFETLLDLMNVHFVRNNQLTVIPFPFKYLREYVKQQGQGFSGHI